MLNAAAFTVRGADSTVVTERVAFLVGFATMVVDYVILSE
jgi:hypothetical protein